MQESPRDQFFRYTKFNAAAFEASVVGLSVSYHFPGSDGFLQLPDGTDGESEQGGYASWQAQLREPDGGDPAVITTFLDGTVEVAELVRPWREGPMGSRSSEHQLTFAPFNGDAPAGDHVTEEMFAEAVVRSARAALRRRSGRYQACDCCGNATPQEQLRDTACIRCHESYLQ